MPVLILGHSNMHLIHYFVIVSVYFAYLPFHFCFNSVFIFMGRLSVWYSDLQYLIFQISPEFRVSELAPAIFGEKADCCGESWRNTNNFLKIAKKIIWEAR